MDIQQLRIAFLERLYDLHQLDSQPMIGLDQVAEHMQNLIPPDNHFVGRLERIVDYLSDKGYVETHSDEYVLLSITASGTDFVESVRESQDSESRTGDVVPDWSSLRQELLEAIYDEANGDLQKFISTEDVYTRLRLPHHMKDKVEGCADQLAASDLITVEVDEGGLYRITIEGMSVVENNRREREEATNQIMNSGSVIDSNGKTVFVVHGRNELLKSHVKNVLHEIELKPVLLDAQTNSGKTIMEKFEANGSLLLVDIKIESLPAE